MTETRLRIGAVVLAVLGIAIASYITIAESGGGSPVCVAGSTGCQTVSESDYSEIAGINVAIFGIVGYVMLLITALTPGDLGRAGGVLISLIGFGFTMYLTYLEFFVIEAICQWCIASAVVMTVLTVVNVIRGWRFLATQSGPTPNMEP